MKTIKSTAAAIAMLATASVAQADTYTIESVEITQLFSATFDGLVFQKAVSDDGSFFGAVPDISNPVFGVNRSIQINNIGGTGSGVLTFDGTELDELYIRLPDTNLTIITGATTVLSTDTSNASLRISDGNIVDGGDEANFDLGGPLSAGATGELVDFSTFNNLLSGELGVVDTCSDGAGNCGLLPALSLDGVRFTLEGSPTSSGGDTYTLRAQTSNTSYYEIEFVTAAVAGKNVPAMGAFGLAALFGGLVAVAARLRRRVA